MEESCDKLREQFRDAAEKIRSKVRQALPSSDTPGEAGRGEASTTGGADVNAATRSSSARVKVVAARGPYDGAIFELLLEGDGEPRMLGRSSGKKVHIPPSSPESSPHSEQGGPNVGAVLFLVGLWFLLNYYPDVLHHESKLILCTGI